VPQDFPGGRYAKTGKNMTAHKKEADEREPEGKTTKISKTPKIGVGSERQRRVFEGKKRKKQPAGIGGQGRRRKHESVEEEKKKRVPTPSRRTKRQLEKTNENREAQRPGPAKGTP